MLIEMAIGDAYGAGFETMPDDFIAENNDLTQYIPRSEEWRPKNAVLGVGYYTDDTQMSIALAEHILQDRPWTLEAVADSFIGAYGRDPRPWAYSKRMVLAFNRATSAGEFMATLAEGAPSEGNGTVMRVPVLAYLGGVEAIDAKNLSATVTNHSHIALSASRDAYKIMRLAMAFRDSKEVVQLLPRFRWDARWRVSFTFPFAAVWAAADSLFCVDTNSDVLRRAIQCGGDTDTTAALAMATASWCGDIKHDLPDFLFEQLENGRWGRDYLIDLDKQLNEKFCIKSPQRSWY